METTPAEPEDTVTQRAMETLTKWEGSFVVFDDNKNIYRECILVRQARSNKNSKDFLYLVRFSDFEEKWMDMSISYRIDKGFDPTYLNTYGDI